MKRIGTAGSAASAPALTQRGRRLVDLFALACPGRTKQHDQGPLNGKRSETRRRQEQAAPKKGKNFIIIVAVVSSRPRRRRPAFMLLKKGDDHGEDEDAVETTKAKKKKKEGQEAHPVFVSLEPLPSIWCRKRATSTAGRPSVEFEDPTPKPPSKAHAEDPQQRHPAAVGQEGLQELVSRKARKNSPTNCWKRSTTRLEPPRKTRRAKNPGRKARQMVLFTQFIIQ